MAMGKRYNITFGEYDDDGDYKEIITVTGDYEATRAATQGILDRLTRGEATDRVYPVGTTPDPDEDLAEGLKAAGEMDELLNNAGARDFLEKIIGKDGVRGIETLSEAMNTLGKIQAQRQKSGES